MIFTINNIDDVKSIPVNTQTLVWTIPDRIIYENLPIGLDRYLKHFYLRYPFYEHSIDFVKYFKLERIQFYTFHDKPFVVPDTIRLIDIYDENDNIFSPLYISYSEYIVPDNRIIKIDNKSIEFVPDSSRYYSPMIKMIDNGRIIKYCKTYEITFEDIEMFLTPGLNIKPAKN